MNFGFELEGFYKQNGSITLPPTDFPTDDFKGLCEVRTFGGKASLEEAYFDLLCEYSKYQFDIETSQFKFSTSELSVLRRRGIYKDQVNIQNLYGKVPRELNRTTFASLQLNISHCTRNEFYDKEGRFHAAEYSVFDYVPIIRALDKEFGNEITAANRQIGWYAVKDNCRVEYRSLPNTLFTTDIQKINLLLQRIKKCLSF